MRYVVVCFPLCSRSPVTTDFRLIALCIGRLLGMVHEQVLVVDTDTGALIAAHGPVAQDRAYVAEQWRSDSASVERLPRTVPGRMAPTATGIGAGFEAAGHTYLQEFRE